MRIDVLTLFPELFEAFGAHSILGRALQKGLFSLQAVNIRDFSASKHKNTDDYPYGGGAGMVMTPQPLADSLKHVFLDHVNRPKVIYFSPQGKVLTQGMARDFAQEEALILLCGHYEGIDQRILDIYVDQEISIGDYVLTGGELPAMVFMDCVLRLLPGVLGSPESIQEESHTNGCLEYPQYTRPQYFDGCGVPEVLLSGNHKEIVKWRRTESLRATLQKRPDLLLKAPLSEEDMRILEALKRAP